MFMMIIVRFFTMDENMKKCPQVELGSQTDAFILIVHLRTKFQLDKSKFA